MNWLEDFEKEHPASPALQHGQPPLFSNSDSYMDTPNVLLSFALFKSILMQSLGQNIQSSEGQPGMSLQVSNMDMRALQDYASGSSIKEWFGDMEVGGGLAARTTIKILLSRLRDSRHRLMLSTNDLTAIFQSDSGHTSDRDLEQISIEEVNELLYGEHVDSQSFLARMHAIKRWLEHDDKFSNQTSSQILVLHLLLFFILVDPSQAQYLTPAQHAIRPGVNVMMVKDAINQHLDSCREDIQQMFATTRDRLRLVISFPTRRIIESCDISALMESHDECMQLLQKYENSHLAAQVDILGSTHLQIARLEETIAWKETKSVELSPHLYKADEYFEQLRSELSALSGIDALEVKSRWRDL